MKPRPSWQLSGHLNAVAASVYDFNLLLAAHVAAKQWHLALDMFSQRSRSGSLLDIVSLNTCVRARQDNWVFALLFFANILAHRIQVDERTIGTLMTCSGRINLWKTSEALFWNMFALSLRANAICQSSLMTPQLSQHQWSWALAVWARMVQFDVEQDQTSRNIALNAWCHGRWVQAGALLRDPVDSESFSTVACSRSFAWRKSESFLCEMQQSRNSCGQCWCCCYSVWSSPHMAENIHPIWRALRPDSVQHCRLHRIVGTSGLSELDAKLDAGNRIAE